VSFSRGLVELDGVGRIRLCGDQTLLGRGAVRLRVVRVRAFIFFAAALASLRRCAVAAK
jgi:hypothetical protein